MLDSIPASVYSLTVVDPSITNAAYLATSNPIKLLEASDTSNDMSSGLLLLTITNCSPLYSIFLPFPSGRTHKKFKGVSFGRCVGGVVLLGSLTLRLLLNR